MAGRVGTGNGRYYALMARGKRYGPDPVTCRTIPVLTSSWTSIERGPLGIPAIGRVLDLSNSRCAFTQKIGNSCGSVPAAWGE